VRIGQPNFLAVFYAGTFIGLLSVPGGHFRGPSKSFADARVHAWYLPLTLGWLSATFYSQGLLADQYVYKHSMFGSGDGPTEMSAFCDPDCLNLAILVTLDICPLPYERRRIICGEGYVWSDPPGRKDLLPFEEWWCGNNLSGFCVAINLSDPIYYQAVAPVASERDGESICGDDGHTLWAWFGAPILL
jgi:hypothetical protein